ncbi:MAG: tetratricopeptide repeat protein [Rubrivivax sp.]|nr:tetratricopeptide repeat protein [Rubrivivax sp.]
MKSWIALLTVLLLQACAAVVPPAPATEAAFDDALFAPLAAPPDPRTLLAVTPTMRRYLDERVLPRARRAGGARQALLQALADPNALLLDYDASRTRTAAEAFAARRGNCLSLVLMTAALAGELGLPVRLHEVLTTAEVEHSGDLTFIIGHVNLALGAGIERAFSGTDPWLIVDFLPGQDLRQQQRRIVDERRVAAMFMNNRAAEEMLQGRLREAYGWLRGAHAQDARFAPLYNTLGVLYRRHGALAQAERALQTALALDPQDPHARANLMALQRLRLARPQTAAPAPAG